MKRWMIAGTVLIISIASIGCSQAVIDNVEEAAYKTVGVIVTEKRMEDETLAYTGIIKPDVQKKLSFKMSGYFDQIFINEGDYVEIGTMLGSIDTQDMSMQLASLGSQSQMAEKEVLKANEALLYSQTQYDSFSALYEEGAVSKLTLDSKNLTYEQAKLNHDITQDQSNRLYSEKARLTKAIEAGTIYADQSGVVSSIMFEKSEFIAPGQPVFIIGSSVQKIVIHVTREDRKLLEVGQIIHYVIDDEKKEGTIVFVDDVADAQTSTYKVELGIEEEEVLSGTIVRVEVIVGKSEGIWVPIQCIQSTTIDFVFVIEDGRSSRRSIVVLEMKGDEALVDGLEENEILIVSGMKSLVEGMQVKAQELEG
jgi:RND family efflux transporter MFP subunit